MSVYISKYAVCPYYSRNSDNKIRCEGVDETNTINLVFESKTDLKAYERRYCESLNGYSLCRICRMLDEKWKEISDEE